MPVGLRQIDRDIAAVQGRISAKNEAIMSRLRMGNDTLSEERQVGDMNTALQGMQGVRRKLVSGLRALLPPPLKKRLL
jgi:hypothetical protein